LTFFLSYFPGSQFVLACFSQASLTSISFVKTIVDRHIGHVMARESLLPAFGHACVSYVRCSKQKTPEQQSQENGKKSFWLQPGWLQCSPMSNGITSRG
jgi:hypothetical protein